MYIACWLHYSYILIVKYSYLDLKYEHQQKNSHYNEVILTLQICKHYFTFSNYQNTAQLLNRNKVDLLTLYLTIDIRFKILDSINLNIF